MESKSLVMGLAVVLRQITVAKAEVGMPKALAAVISQPARNLQRKPLKIFFWNIQQIASVIS